jgi:hypothetical protein
MSAYQKEFGANKSAYIFKIYLCIYIYIFFFSVSLIGSILIGMYLLSGPVVGGLLNNFEARYIVVIGSIIASISFILSTFSPNIFVYYFVYGILGGLFIYISFFLIYFKIYF